jgi:hypothetical protein
MQASYHPLVDGDVTEIAFYYDEQSLGLGDEFLAELEQAVQIMLRTGARTQPVYRDVRVAMLDRFPYGIYYRALGDIARVLVVKHLHRDPSHGMDRV